jgi:hypothetical protein
VRKSKKRKPDFRRIRPSKTYSLPEIANALNRNCATVRGWRRDGLPTLDGQSPPLVLGSELKAWLQAKWSARKQTCQADELFCFRCQKPKKPKPGSVRLVPNNEKTVTIKAECSFCGTQMNKAGSRAKVSEIEETFRTLMPQVQRLERCDNASVKHTSERQPINKADHRGGVGQISMDFAPETAANHFFQCKHENPLTEKEGSDDPFVNRVPRRR